MLLICSKGHKYDTNSLMDNWWSGVREEGGRCPEVLSYDRMSGSTRCNCVLKDVDKVVERLYDLMFRTRLGGNSELFGTHRAREIYLAPGGVVEHKAFIRQLLLSGFNVKTGYISSRKIRGARSYMIFYRPADWTTSLSPTDYSPQFISNEIQK